MLCFFTNTCEVTKQVKRAIERALLHKLLKYNKYIIHVLVLRLNII